MAQIIIRRDEEGLLVMEVEHDVLQPVAWQASKELVSELKTELNHHLGGDLEKEFDSTITAAIGMLED